VKDQAKAATTGRAPPGGAGGADGAKGENAKSRKREKQKEKRAAELEAGRRRGGASLVEETEEATRRVKSIKSRSRELMQQGLPSSKAARIAAAAVTGATTRALGGCVRWVARHCIALECMLETATCLGSGFDFGLSWTGHAFAGDSYA
jgi:hypothetical protein